MDDLFEFIEKKLILITIIYHYNYNYNVLTIGCYYYCYISRNNYYCLFVTITVTVKSYYILHMYYEYVPKFYGGDLREYTYGLTVTLTAS